MEQPKIDKTDLLSKFDKEYNSFVRIGQAIGPAALGVVLAEFGGQKPHIPTESNFYNNLFREVRNEEIRAKFDGRNYEQLSITYGLCEKQVRTIIHSQAKQYAKPKDNHQTVKISSTHHEALTDLADRHACTMHHVVSLLLDMALQSPELCERLRAEFGEQERLEVCA